MSMKGFFKLTVVLACMPLLGAVQPACAGGISFAFSYDLNNVHALVMLGGELYETTSGGNLILMNKSQEAKNNYLFRTIITQQIAGKNINESQRKALIWLWNRYEISDFISKARHWIIPSRILDADAQRIRESRIQKSFGMNVAQRDGLVNRSQVCSGVASCAEMRGGNAPFDPSCGRIRLRLAGRGDEELLIESMESEGGGPDFDNPFSTRRHWMKRYDELCR